jgi:iron complex outermembrane receptor protein
MICHFGARSRRTILATSALCAGLTAMPVHAETATDTSAASQPVQAGELGEITVTAQKRETSLQTTPIAISVVNAGDLANRHAISLESLGDGSIPSLKIAPSFTRSSALTVGIRGIGMLGDSQQPSRDQGVGVYIDGVYLGRVQGLGAALYDVEQIEVLKGPQGSLFGRNTEGGAISIVTKKPSGEFHLDATVGTGNYDEREAVVHLDLPAFHNIAVKLDGLIQKRGARSTIRWTGSATSTPMTSRVCTRPRGGRQHRTSTRSIPSTYRATTRRLIMSSCSARDRYRSHLPRPCSRPAPTPRRLAFRSIRARDGRRATS